MSAYPLVVHVLVNNIYIIITGRDTSEKGKWQFDWLLRVILRLVGSISPLLASMGMANLIYIINYGGLTGYIVCYFFPAILQLASIHRCKMIFFSPSVSTRNYVQQVDQKGTPVVPPSVRKGDQGTNTSSEDEGAPLLPNRWSRNHSYMTPYSIPGLSHPLFVAAMMVILVVMFVMIVVSIFVHADPMKCISEYEYDHTELYQEYI